MHSIFNKAAAPLLLLLTSSFASAQNSSTALPIVDLGYELHQASEFNETGAYYNFSNIRYAAAPVGELRFKKPVSPTTDRSVVQDGSELRICPQGSAGSTNFTTGPTENEDCLFLDVVVPQKVFERAGQNYSAPVLVWIHGGAYVAGSKDETPAGLVERSRMNSEEGMIYVALNYRLGVFGWLAGPTYQKETTANLGLHDQRLALEWVQNNIHLFGGDKNRVTAMGESAGGGSIIHQMTAFGGSAPSLFQRAIPQSPAWGTFASPYAQEEMFLGFLEELNVTSLASARTLSSSAVIAANARYIGSFSFSLLGPSVDGEIVTQDPKYLLMHGQFDRNVSVLVGHNANEGTLFTPALTSDDQLGLFIQSVYSSIKSAVLAHITDVLYPAVYNGSYPYTDLAGRVALAIGDATILCNGVALHRAFGNQSHGYIFAVSPGYHGQDVRYTYYNDDEQVDMILGTKPNATVAGALQDYITSFVASGVPRSGVDGLDEFPVYGDGAEVVSLDVGGITVAADPAASERCAWWQLGLVY